MSEYKKNLEVQQGYYNSTADKYDQWHIDPKSAKVVDAWNFENLKGFLSDKRIDKCLDLGCGTGRLSHSLLQISKEVYGVDASREVLKIARDKYPDLKLGFAEAVDLPYEDDFFDLVVINGSLHHFFAMEGTFKEAFRVLNKGGVLAILGEPNIYYGKWWNPYKYLFILYRVAVMVGNMFRKNKQQSNEPIEPDAEAFVPMKMKDSLKGVGFDVKKFYTYDFLPRNESKLFLSQYKKILAFDKNVMNKVAMNLGSAIQCFCVKK